MRNCLGNGKDFDVAEKTSAEPNVSLKDFLGIAYLITDENPSFRGFPKAPHFASKAVRPVRSGLSLRAVLLFEKGTKSCDVPLVSQTPTRESAQRRFSTDAILPEIMSTV
jgi:hypothetical protein